MTHHPLDGNAIAADRHFNQPRREDFDTCVGCKVPFDDDNPQHPDQVSLCAYCVDCQEDER